MKSGLVVRSHIFTQIPGLIFGMSTRHGGVSPAPLEMNLSFSVGDDASNVRENRKRFAEMLGVSFDRIAFAGQVHGTNVSLVSEPGKSEYCDALITGTGGLFVAISVADCLPIFLYDPVTRSIAGVHSGWRGTKDRIVERAVILLREYRGARTADLLAWLGPAAGSCCYEIGEEVAVQFDPLYVMRTEGRKPHLDLKSCNRDLLLAAGVSAEKIEVTPDCTIHQGEIYHSFRRDGNKSGRMWVVMGMQNSAI